MHEVDAREQLVEDELDHLLGEGCLLGFHQSFECILHVFHAEVDLLELQPILDAQDVLQTHNVPVLQEL